MHIALFFRLVATITRVTQRSCNSPCSAQSKQLDSCDLSFLANLRSSVSNSKIGTAPMQPRGNWPGWPGWRWSGLPGDRFELGLGWQSGCSPSFPRTKVAAVPCRT
ncbi:uncharacterized protein BKA55DRAFT_152931 [Fusarium redolens]|uniref:Secreted protein n=1 Tax=Fusarium redolens TaxID=48865 RepID=A0A9P9KQT4_FUSRE|nr:uncharacterized protein BKA55DRAFT_152931 [Fusarium redolens]KAH7266836.1 hypothetical protein BKA55DRAFT_152931 [Fusarium redolens]